MLINLWYALVFLSICYLYISNCLFICLFVSAH
nr:MAG TPA: hypothetical protein [Caudoviricetes sp.]